ncbi:MAG: hypothetical protein IVW52_04890 [Acidimicrobiales bacterium]|nr:hypothetical protein [Acidimicrobiales bacterium]
MTDPADPVAENVRLREALAGARLATRQVLEDLRRLREATSRETPLASEDGPDGPGPPSAPGPRDARPAAAPAGARTEDPRPVAPAPTGGPLVRAWSEVAQWLRSGGGP